MSNYRSYFLKSLGLREDQLPGGKGDGTSPIQITPEQLKMGIKVEMEHTYDVQLAKEIALDHLTEDPDYYSHLKDAGMADELPNGMQPSQGPMKMNKLMGGPEMSIGGMPKIHHPSVIAIAVRGTKSGGLPAGGRVDNPETAKYGGWEKIKVLPQGGVVGDPEKARLGGLERVTNLKPNSQGAISDTPASEQIKSKGGHFTPDNGTITRGEAPETNVKGSDAIHPMQVQQIGNPPIEDDGTTRDGENTPAAAEAGIEGGESPASTPSEHPLSKFMNDDGNEEDLTQTDTVPGANVAEPDNQDKFGEPQENDEEGTEDKDKPLNPDKPNTGPWGIELDGEEKPEDGTNEDGEEENDEDDKEEGEEVSVDIKETLNSSKRLVKEGKSCGPGNENMKRRFQKLANIERKPMGENEAGAMSEKHDQLRALIDKMKLKGKMSEAMVKAEKYLAEYDRPEAADVFQQAGEVQEGQLDSLIQTMVKGRNPDDKPEDVAELVVAQAQDHGMKGIERRYDHILTQVTQHWR